MVGRSVGHHHQLTHARPQEASGEWAGRKGCCVGEGGVRKDGSSGKSDIPSKGAGRESELGSEWSLLFAFDVVKTCENKRLIPWGVYVEGA